MSLNVSGNKLFLNDDFYEAENISTYFQPNSEPNNSLFVRPSSSTGTTPFLYWVDNNNIYYARSEDVRSTSEPNNSISSINNFGYNRLYIAENGRLYHILPFPEQQENMYTDIDTENDPYNPTTLTYPIASSLVNASASRNAVITRVDFVVQSGNVLNVNVKKNNSSIYTIDVNGSTGTFTRDTGLQSSESILLDSNDTLNFDITFENSYQVFARLYWVNPPSTYNDSQVIYPPRIILS